MGYRIGDETVEIECRVEHRTSKAVLIEPTCVGPAQVWVPKSQIVNEHDPDDEGKVILEITEWFARKEGLA